MSGLGRLPSIVLDCGPSKESGFLAVRSIPAPLRLETKRRSTPWIAISPKNGISVENEVAKTVEIDHSCNPV